MLEGDVRVGLRGNSCELRSWERMTQKEKDEFLAAESEASDANSD